MPDLPSAEKALELSSPGYLKRVRTEVERLGAHAAADDPVRDALLNVEGSARFDSDPPIHASQPGGRVVKRAIKGGVSWYFRYVTMQIAAFSEAVASLGAALADRLDDLERSNRSLQSRLDQLDRRVEIVERNDGSSTGT